MERMEALTNRLRRLIHQDMAQAGQNPRLNLVNVLEAILLQSTLRDIRNETLMRYLESKDLINKDIFASILCDVMDEHVEMMQTQLRVKVADDGTLIRLG